jgi:hypothetical protein
MIVGIIEQMLHRRATLQRVGLEQEDIMKTTLDLVTTYLKTK